MVEGRSPKPSMQVQVLPGLLEECKGAKVDLTIEESTQIRMMIIAVLCDDGLLTELTEAVEEELEILESSEDRDALIRFQRACLAWWNDRKLKC